MKLSVGAKWGALVGLVDGAIAVAALYLQRDLVAALMRQELARAAASSGAAIAPAQMEQILQIAMATAYVAALIGPLILFTIIGLIMAAVWDRLKLPWYSIGAIFGLALALIGLVGIGTTRLGLEGLAGPLQNFALSLLLAYLLKRAGGT
ncbi:MAG: hypothetical protein ABWJ97_01010 [Thermoproteus sp.]